MNEYVRQLGDAAEATTIHTANSYSWMGERSPPLPPKVRRALTPTTARAYLRFSLQSRLYESFYRLGRTEPREGEKPGRPLGGQTPFVDALSAANRGHGFVDDGWIVRQVHDATAIVEKHGLSVWVPVEECRVRPGTQVAAGDAVGLAHPKELTAYSPGFYSAFGDRPFPASTSAPVLRLYWNLTADGAASFVQTVSGRLNRALLPFRFKVLSDPERYGRCDAAVLYMPAHAYRDAAPIIEQIYTHVAPVLHPATPAFTKPLAPGLGLAEDPPGGHSFGMHRCGLVADGLIAAHNEAASSTAERVQHVITQFEESGIDIDVPYLNPDSTDRYDAF